MQKHVTVKSTPKIGGAISDKAIIWIMTLPFLIHVLIFHYVPLYGWYMAFVRYVPGIPLYENVFVGLRYFKMFFTAGSEMLGALQNTVAMSLLNILFSPLPIVFAILINEVGNMKVRKILQTTTSIPNFISFIITYSIFFTFLSVEDGAVNKLLLYLGIIDSPWNILADRNLVWFFQTGVVNMWKTMGWTAIIYISAITSIDQELYSAAKVDGCGRFKQILHVTVPGILPTYAVLLLLSIGSMLSGTNFEQVYIFNNPMVAEKIQTIDYYTYRVGMQMSNFSIGTAVGIAKTIVSIILLLSFNSLSKRLFERSLI